MSDNTHLNGQKRPTVSPEDVAGRAVPANDQFDTPAALLRLLIGGILVGADELQDRLRGWDATTRSAAQAASRPASPDPTSPEALRYALVGMLFDSEARVRRGFASMLARLERLSDEAESYFDEAFAADEQPTRLDPLLKRLDDLLDAAGARVNRWAERGWVEEQHGRRMARQASVSVVDELLDYMARNPEVRELIEQQATSMAGVAVGEVRGRSETADLWIERLAHRVLRRPESETTATDAEGAAARAPAEAQASVAPATRPLPAPANNARAPHAAATVETDAETATRGTSGG